MIDGIDELISYFPIFKKYAFSKLSLPENESVKIITGLPPIYKDKATILQEQGIEVLPQGVGIYQDIKDRIEADKLLIIDIGFNTVDYLVVAGGRKKKGNTIIKQGVEALVRLFQNKLPTDYDYLKRIPVPQLMREFEKGYTIVAGEKIDLSSIKQKAIEEYNEMLKARLKNEIGDFLDIAETIVVAGGGAYYLKGIREIGVFVPENPEFSQARGYAKIT